MYQEHMLTNSCFHLEPKSPARGFFIVPKCASWDVSSFLTFLAKSRTTTGFEKAAELIDCHQEHFDGDGLSAGLEGERIPLISRIRSVPGILDATTSDRPQRRAQSFACASHESGAGLDGNSILKSCRISTGIVAYRHVVEVRVPRHHFFYREVFFNVLPNRG